VTSHDSAQRAGEGGQGHSKDGEKAGSSNKRGRNSTGKKVFHRALCALLLTLSVSGAEAQQAGKVARIGYLEPGTASGNTVLLDGFRQELSKLGWIEGKNITVEYRFGEQNNESYLSLRRTWSGLRLT
jgi:hypothetical protein